MLSILHHAALWCFPLALTAAAVNDLRRFEIPNFLSVALILAYPVAAFTGGAHFSDILWHAGASALVLAVGFGLFALGVFGGGDAKLLAATAFWTGFPHLPALLLVMAFTGGGLAVMLWLARKMAPKSPEGQGAEREPQWPRLLISGESRIPYGVAIAAGGLNLFFQGPGSAGFLAFAAP